MKKFVVEMAVGFGASLIVEAENQEDAIEIAKGKVIESPSEYIDEVEIEGINFVQEVKGRN